VALQTHPSEEEVEFRGAVNQTLSLFSRSFNQVALLLLAYSACMMQLHT
jgi:hypothetical protein